MAQVTLEWNVPFKGHLLQLLQRTLHMGALLFICITNGYDLLGKRADFLKKVDHTEKYFFL